MKNKNNYYFLIILFFALCGSFLFLKEYPFVSLYDQVRDGGLNARQIFDGTIKNILGYGRYASHGLIIPAIGSLFYAIFKDSVLTFRFPGAIIATLDVLLLYFAIKKFINQKTAFFGALILTVIPLHLYFARTEIVVIYSSFFTTLIIFLLSRLITKPQLSNFIVLGLVLGFVSGFHTSIRTVCFVTLSLVTLYSFYKKQFVGLVLFILFILVGFGPRILYSPPEILFQTRSLETQHLVGNYFKSLLVYVKEPTYSTHYADFQPLLSPVLAIFFLIGFLSAPFSKNIFLRIVFLYCLILPFTNSAITEAVNSDNRLLPLIPIAAILTAYGIFFSSEQIKKIIKKEQIILIFQFILFLFILFQGFSFFWQEKASKQYSLPDYLSMHTVYFLKGNKEYQKLNAFCFNVSPKIYPYFQLMHVQEQYQYFVPGKTITVIADPNVLDNQIIISTICQNNVVADRSAFAQYQPCAIYQKFTCLRSGKQPEIIYQTLPSTIKTPFQNNSNTTIIPPYATIIP